jgi:Holliday junction resolvase
MLCQNKSFENIYCKWKRKQGHLAMRIAGSGSSSGAYCDCIVIQDGKTTLVEVKSCKGTVLYVTSPVHKQLATLLEVCKKYIAKPVLAIRFKNRGWREIDLDEIPKKVEY